jgi:hypothetical protein
VRTTIHYMEVLMPDIASRMLPPYRGILAVDTERFTGNPSAHQTDLSAAVQEVLRVALERCGHLQIWEQRRFPQGTGDGYLFGVLPEVLPFLLSPFLGALHETLAEKDDSLRGTALSNWPFGMMTTVLSSTRRIPGPLAGRRTSRP